MIWTMVTSILDLLRYMDYIPNIYTVPRRNKAFFSQDLWHLTHPVYNLYIYCCGHTFSIIHFQTGLHMKPYAYPRITFGSRKNRHTVFPCETQNVVFVLLFIIVSPFHQHIPCDIVVVFGYLRLIGYQP